MSSMGEVVYHPYRQGDELGILVLYRQVFHLNMSLDFWRWMYQSPPAGSAVVTVAESKGELIGHYAVLPVWFVVDQKPTLAALAVGTMVAPAFRNLTTLVELARLNYELCRQRGIRFLYAFPNDRIWPVRRAMLGWKAAGELVPLEVSLTDWQVGGSSDRIHLVDHFDERWDDLWEAIRTATPQGVLAVRTTAQLAWRYIAKPGVKYAILAAEANDLLFGYTVLKRYQVTVGIYGHLLDLQILPGYEELVGSRLLAAARAQFCKWGVDFVSCWSLPSSPLYSLLRESGLVPAGKAVNFGYRLIDPDFPEAQLSPGAWQVTMGDSDVY